MKKILKFFLIVILGGTMLFTAFSHYRFNNGVATYTIHSDNKNVTVPQFDWDSDTLGVASDVMIGYEASNAVDFTHCYAYSTLSEDEQIAYGLIYDVLMTHTPSIHLNTDIVDSIDAIYQSVCADHGNIFWTDGYDYTYYKQDENIIDIVFSPRYTYSISEREDYQSIIDERVKIFLSGVTEDMTDYEKSKYIYDVLIQNVKYNKESEHNQNIISVFMNGETVCRGYACAVQYMSNILGLDCCIVDGLVGQEPHTWNLIKLDGKWYYFDVTWGNSNYTSNGDVRPYVDYNYLNVTENDIRQTHSIRKVFDLPTCDATKNNYFVKEQCFFAEYDEKDIGSLISECEKGDVLYLKFSNGDIYDMVLNIFFVDKVLFDYCNDNIKGYQYIEDTIHHSIMILF